MDHHFNNQFQIRNFTNIMKYEGSCLVYSKVTSKNIILQNENELKIFEKYVEYIGKFNIHSRTVNVTIFSAEGQTLNKKVNIYKFYN